MRSMDQGVTHCGGLHCPSPLLSALRLHPLLPARDARQTMPSSTTPTYSLARHKPMPLFSGGLTGGNARRITKSDTFSGRWSALTGGGSGSVAYSFRGCSCRPRAVGRAAHSKPEGGTHNAHSLGASGTQRPVNLRLRTPNQRTLKKRGTRLRQLDVANAGNPDGRPHRDRDGRCYKERDFGH